MKVLDLFSGIGGFSLGLERAGFKTVAFCEIEPYCRAVLKKHWPDVPQYDDVRTLTAERLAADGIRPDVICGGFPCQDISVAGKGAGISGERSGLWKEYARLIGELRPRYVIVENVAALLGRGMGVVLGDLAEIGYDAEWKVISAADVGAPHLRERIWIISHDNENSKTACTINAGKIQKTDMGHPEHAGFDATKITGSIETGIYGYKAGAQQAVESARPGSQFPYVADSDEKHGRCEPQITIGGFGETLCNEFGGIRKDLANTNCAQRERVCGTIGIQQEYANAGCGGWWEVEPDVGRVANGVSSRVDRLKGLGNAVVPQIPEIIGRAIMQAEGIAA